MSGIIRRGVGFIQVTLALMSIRKEKEGDESEAFTGEFIVAPRGLDLYLCFNNCRVAEAGKSLQAFKICACAESIGIESCCNQHDGSAIAVVSPVEYLGRKDNLHGGHRVGGPGSRL